MTDEEFAEEYCSAEVFFDITESGEKLYTENDLKQACLAGLKAGRPKWHDLRKDPKDLPKEVGNYIVCYLDTACERHTFCFVLSFVDYFEDKHWIDEDNYNIEGFDEGFDEGVIAWCEIPEYTEE